MMNKDKIDCKNCEQPFEQGFTFCPNCGQKTNEELTIGVLFYNTISNYFSFDARFLKSFIPLMFKPGYLAKRFLEGKRLLYLHPAQMYLFVSVIFFFLFSFTVNDFIEDADKVNGNLAESESINLIDENSKKVIDSVMLEALEKNIVINQDSAGYNKETQKAVDSIVKKIKNKDYNSNINFGISKKRLDSLRQAGVDDIGIYKDMGMDDDAGSITRGFYKSLLDLADGKGLGNWIKRFSDTIPIAMFFLLPLFALILKVFYYNRGPYAYHLVFSFYFFSFLFTLFCMLLAFNRFVIEIPVVISVLIVLSVFIYFFMALQKFYKNFWMLTFIKSTIITFFFLMMVLPLAFVLIGALALVNA